MWPIILFNTCCFNWILSYSSPWLTWESKLNHTRFYYRDKMSFVGCCFVRPFIGHSLFKGHMHLRKCCCYCCCRYIAHSMCPNLTKILNLDKRNNQNGLYIAFCRYIANRSFASLHPNTAYLCYRLLSTVSSSVSSFIYTIYNMSTDDKSTNIICGKISIIHLATF